MDTVTAPSGTALAQVEQCLAQMDALDATLHVVITRVDEQARAEAVRCDRAAARGEWLGPLHGMPVALKDNIDTAGVRTTSGSAFFADRVPERDAEVVRRLKAAGAVIVAKVNLAEFAFGGTSQNPHFGPCRNPWDPARIPGGSSGGSGAAVAAGMCVGSLGTDTGGSIRIPASLNGVVGLRPTIGRVSNAGTTPVSLFFDTVGPLARRVVDVARLFAAMAACDPSDPSSRPHLRQDVLNRLHEPIAGVRIGVPEVFFFEDIEPDIEASVRAALEVLQKLGAELVAVTLPEAERAQGLMTKILYPDAAAFHRDRITTEPDRFGEDVLRRLSIGVNTSGMDYADAALWRLRWQRRVDQLFDQVDLVAHPTVPFAAPVAEGAEMIATTTSLTRLTYAWSMADVPCMSIPCGFDAAGLPVGLHLAAARWNDALLFPIGAAYQRETDWHLRTPPGVPV